MARSLLNLAHERASGRIQLMTLGLIGLFAAIAVLLVTFGLDPADTHSALPSAVQRPRPDITDRNGVLLAKDLKSFSVYAEPRRIIDVDEAFEDLGPRDIRRKLTSSSGPAWIKRAIPPAKADRVWPLGLAGIHLRPEPTRVYPNGGGRRISWARPTSTTGA